MFFLDKTGLLSIVSLFIQCGTAWIFSTYLAVLATRGGPWLRAWSRAFLALGIGLGALVLRFALAHHAAAGDWVMEEGELATRLFYATYMAGKFLFAWGLLAGVARLRGRNMPTAWYWSWGCAVACGVVGAVAPTIECLLLFQASWLPVFMVMTARWLRPPGGAEWPLGERIVSVVLLVRSVLWLFYATAVLAVGPLDPVRGLWWGHVLRLNSLVDLAVQVVLGVGLVIVVMSETQRLIVAALQERDHLREQVQRDEKVRALSTLVSGVAHEINNPLTAILGFAADLDAADAPTREHAARIVRDQAERCRGIVQRMSLLGRRAAVAHTHIDVAELARRVVDGFAPQARTAGIELRLAIDGALAPFFGDATGLEQVLANLVGNALQASPRGTAVQVRVREQDSLRIEVLDQGPGVPVADRVRVFEPFWTTKEVGVGTGLGLAVVDAIVRTHGGTVSIDEAPGGGARFTVELPLARQVAVAAVLQPTQVHATTNAGSAAVAKLSLLVVDDEPMVRSAIARAAAARAWQVTEAGSGEAALALLLAPGARYDAIVCDLRMPGMTGADLHDVLSTRRPAWLQRMVFITGDLASADAVAFAERCRAPIVGKPFQMGELLDRMRGMALALAS